MNRDPLFQPLRLGRLQLPNRIAMAPMTRSRADDSGVMPAMAATYYAQRAGAGLIVAEGAFPSAMGKGYVRTPGIHTDAQAAGWRRVTQAVHAQGGAIFLQIMHVGRISRPELLPGGAQPVAPSAVRAEGSTYTDAGMKPFVVPRALTLDEIGAVIDEHRAATARALAAGFDGVELHAASGYLAEQFLSSRTNRRDDRYGGPIAHRVRFVLEALDAMARVAGPERVGIKIAPELGFNDIGDDAPQALYAHLARTLRGRGLAYLHVADGSPDRRHHALLRPLFDGPYLAGAGFDADSGAALLRAGGADAIVYGRPFVANPDLPERFRRGAPLAEPDAATLYAGGARGYVDYPGVDGPIVPAHAMPQRKSA